MKKISVIALVAALSFGTAAIAQVSTDASGALDNSTQVSADAGGGSTNVDVNASTSVGGGADVSTPAGDVSASAGGDVGASGDVSASTGDDTSASAGGDVSASGDLSASGEVSTSSEMESSSAMASSMASEDCDSIDTTSLLTTEPSATDLAAVTSVTVYEVSACSNLTDMAPMAGTAADTLGANASVKSAIDAAGYSGDEIVGYMVDGTSLTVYVKSGS